MHISTTVRKVKSLYLIIIFFSLLSCSKNKEMTILFTPSWRGDIFGCDCIVPNPHQKLYGAVPKINLADLASRLIKELQDEGCFLIILISSLLPEQEEQIALECEFNLIISSNHENYPVMKQIGATAIVSSLNTVGVIKAGRKGDSYTFTFEPMKITYLESQEDKICKEKMSAFLKQSKQ